MTKYSIIILFFALFLFSCEHSHSHDDQGHAHEADGGHAHEEEEHPADEVHLTDAQLETIGLKIGTFKAVKLAGFVKANGILDLPPDEFASVTAPAEGFVKDTKGTFLVGSYVKKGTVLAALEHPNYIQQQQNYLEVLAKLDFQKEEVKRQQTLSAANAGIERTLQQAQSDLKVLEARKEGFRQQLLYLGLSPEKIQEGSIFSQIALLAPISGYITAVNIHKGQFVKPETELYEIVNNDHVHLELDIFEKDIAKIKVGQPITFTIPSLGKETFEGVVQLIGRSFNTENKTIRVHGHITGKHPEFIRGLYLNAKIWINDQTVQALPVDAVVSDGGLDYIFVKMPPEEEGSVHFKKITVKKGSYSGDYIEITPIDPIINKMAIVLDQAFFLLAEMRKGELKHEH